MLFFHLLLVGLAHSLPRLIADFPCLTMAHDKVPEVRAMRVVVQREICLRFVHYSKIVDHEGVINSLSKHFMHDALIRNLTFQNRLSPGQQN